VFIRVIAAKNVVVQIPESTGTLANAWDSRDLGGEAGLRAELPAAGADKTSVAEQPVAVWSEAT
jgi:hypothetical protein